jgi:phosphoglycolate phosphatase
VVRGHLSGVIRAIVFDLDGTLVDSLPGISASVNRVRDDLGLQAHPQAAVRGFVGNGLAMLARRAMGGDAPDELIASFVEAFRRDYAATWAEGTLAYPGIPEALEKLAAAGVPLAVWSNKPQNFTEATVVRIFPGFRFAAVIGEREGIPRKPDPASAAEIVGKLGYPTEEIAMIGDSTVDIESGCNAGFTTVAVTWGYHDRDRLAAAKPDHWIERPGELPGLLPAR